MLTGTPAPAGGPMDPARGAPVPAGRPAHPTRTLADPTREHRFSSFCGPRGHRRPALLRRCSASSPGGGARGCRPSCSKTPTTSSWTAGRSSICRRGSASPPPTRTGSKAPTRSRLSTRRRVPTCTGQGLRRSRGQRRIGCRQRAARKAETIPRSRRTRRIRCSWRIPPRPRSSMSSVADPPGEGRSFFPARGHSPTDEAGHCPSTSSMLSSDPTPAERTSDRKCY